LVTNKRPYKSCQKHCDLHAPLQILLAPCTHFSVVCYPQSRGADPSLRTEDYDPYLNPGRKLPIEVAIDDDAVRAKLLDLEKKYASQPKAKEPHPHIGCWWTVYDYGLEAVKKWDVAYVHPYPEEKKRQRDAAERKAAKDARRKARAEAAAKGETTISPAPRRVASGPVAFLFPGQGSQAVGMLKESKDLPVVQKMLATARDVLGYDLLKLCLEGPKEELDNTIYSQPALFVAGLAAVERLRAENPSLVDGCAATAGLSLGEYTALVFAGAMSFEDGLRVVKVRAESMSAAAKAGRPHGMLSVVGLSDADLESVCTEARAKFPNCVCQVANYLFPQGRVVSGHKEALDEAQRLAAARGALKAVPVAVSGAFHTELMAPAREALTAVLETVAINDPVVPVYSNVTGERFKDAAHIKELLPRQLVEPVRWEPTLRNLIAEGRTQMHELGPGAQIKAMVKRIDNAIWQKFKNLAA
jgi:[acyl-carrier-protein] S-malonyltransferase